MSANVVGMSIRRADGEAKVRGEPIFAIDYMEEGALHARLLRSEVPAARIVRLDTSRAEAMPGVWAVATAADAPGHSGWVVKDAMLFARDRVSYIGEPIAAVAAETIGQAWAATEAIDFEVEPEPSVTDIEAALAEGAPLVHPGWEAFEVLFPGARNGNVAWNATLEVGDVDAAFARDDVVIIEDEITVPRQQQVYIEPRAAVVRYEAGRYIVHSNTQYAFQARQTIADYLGIRPTDVRVIVQAIGGGFGGKVDAYLEPFCAILARKTGRPVRMFNTREEEFLYGNPREDAIVRIRSAVTREGDIVGREAVCLMNNGACSGELPFCTGISAQSLAGNYRVGSARVDTKLVYTNTMPTGAFRGVLGVYCTLALERHMDHIANELDVDRREFRLRHLIRDGEETPTGQKLDVVPLAEAFERIEEVAPWREISERKPLHGVGIAAVTWVTTGAPGGVTLKLNEDGTIGVINACSEIGSGAITLGVRQIIADEFSVAAEDVVMLPPDTDAAPFDAGAIGSRSVHMIGASAQIASQEVRKKIFATASALLEIAPEDLQLEAGSVQPVGSPDKRIPLATVAQTALWTTGPIQGTGGYAAAPVPFNMGCVVGNLLPVLNSATFHVHMAEVEIDPQTGKVTILRYVVAQEVGKAVNPSAIEGQIQGGVLQGVGYALYEQLRMEGGEYLERDLESYRVPTAMEAPPIEIILLEHPDPNGPFGARGVGESPILPVAAVIANAVSDAIGRPMNALPITPFAVLEALQAAEAGSDLLEVS